MKVTLLFLLSLKVLYSCQPKSTPELKISIDPNTIINTMQGGFCASMHAIEDSLPVSTENSANRS